MPADKPAEESAEQLSGHTIVCGFGHVGYRIVRMLIRLGERGVVVARSAQKDWQADIAPQFKLIIGDARADDFLRQAGIERARSILAVTNDELANVAIALDARRLNPQIKISLRIFDQKLAAHLESAMQINRAMSTSALAMPAFMAAALGSPVHGAFEIDGTHWFIETEVVKQATSTESEQIVPKVHGTRTLMVAQRGPEVMFRPALDHETAAGDRLTFLVQAQPGHGHSQRGKTSRAAHLQAFISGLREWWSETPQLLRFSLLAMALLVFSSVLMFSMVLRISVIDALYFVTSTVTTVGYGDYNLHDVPPWIKLYGCGLMVCGVVIVGTIVSIVTDLIVQTRLRDVIARGCVHAQGHMIVAGLGNIGFRLVQSLLQNGERPVAIECQAEGEFVKTARDLIPVVLGNAKMDETLRRAGAAGAKTVLAVTDNDITNLSIALAAKRARPDCRVVARIFDAALAEKMEPALGIDAMLSVSAAAAPTFIGSVLCDGVIQGIVLGNYLVLVFHRTIGDDAAESVADDKAILWVKPAGAATYQTAASDERIGPGDKVVGIEWRRFVQ